MNIKKYILNALNYTYIDTVCRVRFRGCLNPLPPWKIVEKIRKKSKIFLFCLFTFQRCISSVFLRYTPPPHHKYFFGPSLTVYAIHADGQQTNGCQICYQYVFIYIQALDTLVETIFVTYNIFRILQAIDIYFFFYNNI